MIIGSMAEVDCNAYQIARGITTTSQNFTDDSGKILPTNAIFVNADTTAYVKDFYGNISKKIMVAGTQIIGCYTNIWASESQGVITKVNADAINLIF